MVQRRLSIKRCEGSSRDNFEVLKRLIPLNYNNNPIFLSFPQRFFAFVLKSLIFTKFISLQNQYQKRVKIQIII